VDNNNESTERGTAATRAKFVALSRQESVWVEPDDDPDCAEWLGEADDVSVPGYIRPDSTQRTQDHAPDVVIVRDVTPET